jgi:hypothetical protein
MPFRIRKVKNVNLYYVSDFKGKRYSKEPVSKEEAENQVRALYASEGKEPPKKKTYPGRVRYPKGSELAFEMMKKCREAKQPKPDEEAKQS